MKRRVPWSDEEDDSSSSEPSSVDSESEGEDGGGKSKVRKSSGRSSEVNSAKRKSGAIDFDALTRHGYKGGLSVLKLPAPKGVEKQDWSWSTGKERADNKETEESYRERQKTRSKIADAEEMANVMTRKDKKNASFSQKEKRKRDLGQASRGKNYVEEEKRLLRENGIYSGFDS